jgi:cobaltochelatase CobT
VAARREREGTVELMALGVGLDLSPFYSHAHAVDLAAASGPALVREWLTLISGRRRR